MTTRLILKQPEIAGTKRGRRRLSPYETGVDYKRALAVNARRREKQAAGIQGRITDRELITELVDEKHPLFRSIDDATKSVSKGQTRYKQALAEIRRSEVKAAADKKRQEAKALRQRRSHEASVRRKAATGNPFAWLLSPTPVKRRKTSSNRD